MSTLQLPASGTCRCGKIGIEISADPLMTAACHCTGCQRMSSSAYSLTAVIPSDGFAIVKGEPVVGGQRGPELAHFFCADCMTWIFTRVEGVDDFVNVRPTMLSDPSWFVPFIETMTREKLTWATTPATHRFEGFPSTDEYMELMAAFSSASA